MAAMTYAGSDEQLGLQIDPEIYAKSPQEKAAYYNALLEQGYTDADIRGAFGGVAEDDPNWTYLKNLAAEQLPPTPAVAQNPYLGTQVQAADGTVYNYNDILSQIGTRLGEGKNMALGVKAALQLGLPEDVIKSFPGVTQSDWDTGNLMISSGAFDPVAEGTGAQAAPVGSAKYNARLAMGLDAWGFPPEEVALRKANGTYTEPPPEGTGTYRIEPQAAQTAPGEYTHTVTETPTSYLPGFDPVAMGLDKQWSIAPTYASESQDASAGIQSGWSKSLGGGLTQQYSLTGENLGISQDKSTWDSLKPVVGMAAGALLPGLISPWLSGAGLSGMGLSAGTGALTGAGSALLTGGDPLQGALLGGAGGALTNYFAPVDPMAGMQSLVDTYDVSAVGDPGLTGDPYNYIPSGEQITSNPQQYYGQTSSAVLPDEWSGLGTTVTDGGQAAQWASSMADAATASGASPEQAAFAAQTAADVSMSGGTWGDAVAAANNAMQVATANLPGEFLPQVGMDVGASQPYVVQSSPSLDLGQVQVSGSADLPVQSPVSPIGALTAASLPITTVTAPRVEPVKTEDVAPVAAPPTGALTTTAQATELPRVEVKPTEDIKPEESLVPIMPTISGPLTTTAQETTLPKVEVTGNKAEETLATPISIPPVVTPPTGALTTVTELPQVEVSAPKAEPVKIEDAAPVVIPPVVTPPTGALTTVTELPQVEVVTPKDIAKVEETPVVKIPSTPTGVLSQVDIIAPKNVPTEIKPDDIAPAVTLPSANSVELPRVEVKAPGDVAKTDDTITPVTIPNVVGPLTATELPKVEVTAPKADPIKIEDQTPVVTAPVGALTTTELPKVEVSAPKDVTKVDDQVVAPNAVGPLTTTTLPTADVTAPRDTIRTDDITQLPIITPPVVPQATELPKVEVSAPKDVVKAEEAPVVPTVVTTTPSVTNALNDVEIKAAPNDKNLDGTPIGGIGPATSAVSAGTPSVITTKTPLEKFAEKFMDKDGELDWAKVLAAAGVAAPLIGSVVGGGTSGPTKSLADLAAGMPVGSTPGGFAGGFTPAQQASLFRPFKAGNQLSRIYSADMLSPVVTGQHYADGGEVQGALSLASPFVGYVRGPGGGQDDLIDARLSGGEYVFDAESVSNLGDGNNEEGARKLDELRQNLRAHKRSAPDNQIAPPAMGALSYMNGGRT